MEVIRTSRHVRYVFFVEKRNRTEQLVMCAAGLMFALHAVTGNKARDELCNDAPDQLDIEGMLPNQCSPTLTATLISAPL